MNFSTESNKLVSDCVSEDLRSYCNITKLNTRESLDCPSLNFICSPGSCECNWSLSCYCLTSSLVLSMSNVQYSIN